jgi:hypothetical protein
MMERRGFPHAPEVGWVLMLLEGIEKGKDVLLQGRRVVSERGQGSADGVDMSLCCKIGSTTMSTMELFVSAKGARTSLRV